MANENLYSTLVTDLGLTAMLAQEVQLLKADRNALGSHPAFFYAGSISEGHSATLKVPQIGWYGYDALSDVAENAAASNTAITDANFTISVARKSKVYALSDLAHVTAVDGKVLFNPVELAADAFLSRDLKLTDMIAQVGDDFTTKVSETGVDLDLDHILEAKGKLELANVPGPYICVLHPVQWNDLQVSILGSSNAVVGYSDWAQNMVKASELGYKGSFLGIDFFVSSRVPTANAGADRAGFMAGAGAIAWADANIPADPFGSQNVIFNDGKIKIEAQRDATKAMTSLVFDTYLGVSIAQDGCGVSIVTDA